MGEDGPKADNNKKHFFKKLMTIKMCFWSLLSSSHVFNSEIVQSPEKIPKAALKMSAPGL